jgi:GrpB-like predicted nucleotidyltransferase (UPF0157 family)
MPSPYEPIMVVAADPAWPRSFRFLAERVEAALGEVVNCVEHVGSTAVPRLASKPIVDLDVVVASVEDVRKAIDGLDTLGYRHVGTLGIPGREAFLWPPGERRHHLYVVVAGSEIHHRHIVFREYLRANPDMARLYDALKRRLAHEYCHDRLAYTRHKSPFIEAVMAYAAFDTPDAALKRQIQGVRMSSTTYS